MHIAILTKVQNFRIICWKNSHILLKIVLFDAKFQGEGHLYANYFFYILAICRKCLRIQISRCGTRMHIPIITGVENGQISSWKSGRILMKNVLLRLNLQNEGH